MLAAMTLKPVSGGPQRPFGFAGVQQNAGNLAVQRLFNAGLIQAKLSVSQPDDPYEEEADQVANQVMRMPEPQLQRACACGGACPRCQTDRSGEKRIHTKRVWSSDLRQPEVPATVYDVLRSPGDPLDATTRGLMEQRLGHDFSHVRVHTDTNAAESARAVSARAYTVGGDIVFDRGYYAPATSAGKRLLAHELTHVLQQLGGDEISSFGLNPGKRDPSFGGQQTARIADEAVKQIPSQPATASVAVLQGDWKDDLASEIARDLNDYVAKNPLPYKHVIEVVHFSEARELDDNVAAVFTELQSLAQLEKFAATKEGRDMLDVLYYAMTTGKVTSFESLQSARILFAKWKWMPTEVIKITQLRDPAVAEPWVYLRASKIAEDLNDDVSKNLYRDVIKKMNKLDSDIEDDVASHLLILQSPDKLEKFAANNEGRAMLDVLYEALITGDVTAFERLQAERILAAEAKTSRVPTGAALTKTIQDPPIFPLATGWSSTATIVAELLNNGKVKVFYDTETGLKKFSREREALVNRYGRPAVLNGIILDPDELVIVKLYDQGGAIVPVPAIRLIDFFNQQKQDTLGKIKTVAILGATVGLGGVGAGGVLGWADTVTFAISAGSLFINAYRHDIAKTALGRRFLEAWDVAEGIAEYYDWGRLGVDGLRLVHAKVSPAFKSWRGEAPTSLTSVERDTIAKAQQQTEAWLDAVKQAESAEAAKYLKAHPPKKVEGEPGHRKADIEGGHQVREVPGGLGCKLYSGDGTDVLCPKELLEHTEPPKPKESAKPSVEPTEAAREAEKAKLIDEVKQKMDLNDAEMRALENRINIARENVKDATAKAPHATGKQHDDLLDKARRNKETIERLKGQQEALRWENNALRDQAAVLSIPETAGGSYNRISAKTRKNFSEANHMPAWDSYEDVIDLSHGAGPSIWMHVEDHKLTASHGSTPEAVEHRRIQRELISQGQFMKAFEMDVQDLIKKGLYEKYEQAILQARRYAEGIAEKLQVKPAAKTP